MVALKKQIKEVLKEEDKKKDKDNSKEEDGSNPDDAVGKDFGRGAHTKKKAKKDSA